LICATEAVRGFLVTTCSTSNAPFVDAFVLPTASHDVNLSPRAPELHKAVVDWLR
jgi:hypothetical protein